MKEPGVKDRGLIKRLEKVREELREVLSLSEEAMKSRLSVEEAKEQSLEGLSIVELRARFEMLSSIIRDAQRDGDLRWENLLPSQRRLNRVLTRKLKTQRLRRGESEPETIVVGMKALSMTAKRVSLGKR